ncbi:ribosomal protein L6 [Abortiporus biennis]|nr:ribosomal protein L6 [Abortiporus biennis]
MLLRPGASTQPLRAALRSFSTTLPKSAGQVSNIGKQPIPIPPTVSLTPSTTSTPNAPITLSVKGPLGEATVPLQPFVKLDLTKPETLTVSVEDPSVKAQRSMWGTTRSLINNAVVGISTGFTTPLYLVGVGYRAALEEDPRGKTAGNSGQRLNMKLGFSHPVYQPIPAHIKAEVVSPTKIILSCTDKHELGLFAAKVRRWRPPEPYKGKGIIVGNERVRIRAVKKK